MSTQEIARNIAPRRPSSSDSWNIRAQSRSIADGSSPSSTPASRSSMQAWTTRPPAVPA